MPRLTNYEVYALVHGRWTLHARYPGAERDTALYDARRTERELNVATKVIRESYYPHLNYSDEVTAYISPLAKKQMKAGGKEPTDQRTMRAQAAQAQVAAQDKSKRTPPDIKSSTEFFARFVGAICASFLAAALITVMVRLILQTLPNFGVIFTLRTTQDILTWSFLLSFAFASLSLVRAFAPVGYLFRKTPELFQPPPKAAVQKHDVNFDQPAPKDTQGDHANMRRLRGDLGTEPVVEENPDGTPLPSETHEATTDDAVAHAPDSQVQQTQTAAAEEEPHPLLEGPGKKLTDIVIGRFMDACTPVIGGPTAVRSKDDIWSITWFIYGAADRFAREIGVTSKEIRPLATDALIEMGVEPLPASDTGAQKPATHGYRIGQDAMDSFLNQNISPTGFLQTVLSGEMPSTDTPAQRMEDVLVLSNVFPRSAPEGQFSHDVPGFIREKHANTVRSAADEHKGTDVKPVKAGATCRFTNLKEAIGAVTYIMDKSMELRQHGFALRFCGGFLSSAPDHDVDMLAKRLEEEISAGTPDSFTWSGTLSDDIVSQAKSFSLRQKGLADGEAGTSNTFVPVLGAHS